MRSNERAVSVLFIFYITTTLTHPVFQLSPCFATVIRLQEAKNKIYITPVLSRNKVFRRRKLKETFKSLKGTLKRHRERILQIINKMEEQKDQSTGLRRW